MAAVVVVAGGRFFVAAVEKVVGNGMVVGRA